MKTKIQKKYILRRIKPTDFKKIISNYFKALAESNQLLEKEQNCKNKYEIDYQYMNSLRYTVILSSFFLFKI